MELYRGTKTLFATPMTRGEYNEYRGWTTPVDEDPNDAGMLVEYTDGGKPNDERHKGYISWSPLDVFNKAYYSIDNMTAMNTPDQKWEQREARRSALSFATSLYYGTKVTPDIVLDSAQKFMNFIDRAE